MIALIRRDLRRGLGGGAWIPAVFLLLVATLIPFAVGPDPTLLARIASGGLWVATLTAALLPIDRLVEPDRAAGVLDQLVLRGLTEEAIAAAKVLAHFLSFVPILLAASVPAALMLGMPVALVAPTLLALAVAGAGLSALAVAVAALTAGLPRSGSLAGLLLLPLAIPLLIFGAAASGDPMSGALLLEGAVALLLVGGAPFVAGAAIRSARR